MPLSAFIIRPFGTKTVTTAKETVLEKDGKTFKTVETVEVDFDRVQRELINPVLESLRIRGNTTEAVVAAGNIREDMFHLLMTADLVLADVTIHNANVFYELGIRHAFHDKFTFLIRSDVSTYPFDLQTDRYFEYKHESPGKSVEKLCEALRATVASERADSPVFRLLPRLRSEDRSRFLSVPRDFMEEVERARKYKRGGDLRLLAVECEGFLWEIEGLRIIGRAQFELNYVGGAKATWEAIQSRYPNDVEANTILSTIYQRLNDLTRSEQALARISRLESLDINTVAEVRALSGRNFKARWTLDWMKKKDLPERQKRALQSPLLRKAYEDYEAAFRANLNNSYAGLNALSLLMTEVFLAEKLPSIWESMQERTFEARREITIRKERISRLISALDFTMESERRRLHQQIHVDFWFEILEAAFLCLTAENPARVEQAYLEAIIWAPTYAEEAMRRGLEIYQELGLESYEKVNIKENASRALKVIKGNEPPKKTPGRILLFAGLRMEAEKWKPRRNNLTASTTDPADAAKPVNRRSAAESLEERERAEISYLPVPRIEDATDKIRRRIEAEKEKAKEKQEEILFGMAGGACGGDVIFHELCREAGIETRLYLALPKDQYIGEYVAPAGAAWVERFNKIYRSREILDKPKKPALIAKPDEPGSTKVKALALEEAIQAEAAEPFSELRETDADTQKFINVLTEIKELPRWLQGKANYNLERRCHVWMLQHALVQRYLYERDDVDVEITLIVLWDGGSKEGLGGLGELIKLAELHGIKVVKIDCREWLDPKLLNGDKKKPSVPDPLAALSAPALHVKANAATALTQGLPTR